MIENLTISPEVRELFRKGLEDLQTNGWYQGNYFPEDILNEHDPNDPNEPIPQDCPSCALGALLRATGGLTFSEVFGDKRFNEAEMTLGAWVRANTDWQLVSFWNDAKGRTKDEVLAAFRDLAGVDSPE